jgi:hypothetical protein
MRLIYRVWIGNGEVATPFRRRCGAPSSPMGSLPLTMQYMCMTPTCAAGEISVWSHQSGNKWIIWIRRTKSTLSTESSKKSMVETSFWPIWPIESLTSWITNLASLSSTAPLPLCACGDSDWRRPGDPRWLRWRFGGKSPSWIIHLRLWIGFFCRIFC